MKNESLHTDLCALGISLCLGLGSVGALASGLGLPVNPVALMILCLLLAAILTGVSRFPYGSLILLGFGSILLFNADFLLQFKTIMAEVAEKLLLAYGTPMPEWLEGTTAKQLLPALCFVAGLIMLTADWAVQKQKTAIPAALLSLMPLTCCITVTDTVPHSVWLFLWGLGLVLLLMTQGIRANNVKQANRLTLILLLPAFLALLLLFRFVPRSAPADWTIAQLPQQIFNHFSGVSGPELDLPLSSPYVNLSALGQRQQRQTPIMDVNATFDGILYLRGQDYDEYTGTSWISTSGRNEEIYGFSPAFHQKDGLVEIQVRQALDYYYLPADTVNVQLLTNGQARNPNKARTYLFEHCSLRSDWETNWTDPQIAAFPPRYLRLSDETSQGVQSYLQTTMPMNTLFAYSETQIAEMIGQKLRKLAPYDLSAPNMPAEETDFALWFLNDAESGYCVHFATTAVVLLRACGVPARYVEGYTVTVQTGETVTVRKKNAHAWAEYYVNGLGWQVLEATPGGGRTDDPLETEPTQHQPATEPVTEPVTEPSVPTTSPTPPITQPGSPPTPPDKTSSRWSRSLLLILLYSLAVPTALWAQYQLRRRLFRRSVRRGSINRQALVIYRRLTRLYRWTKKPIPPELTQLAQKARFSNHKLTPAERSQLQGHLRLAEAELSRLPLAKRLCARWLFARY